MPHININKATLMLNIYENTSVALFFPMSILMFVSAPSFPPSSAPRLLHHHLTSHHTFLPSPLHLLPSELSLRLCLIKVTFLPSSGLSLLPFTPTTTQVE